MRYAIQLCLIVSAVMPTLFVVANGSETLGRGLVAVPHDDGSVFLSWRLLPGEDDCAFDVYRHAPNVEAVRINAQPLREATSLVDHPEGNVAEVKYDVRLVRDGKEVERSEPVGVWSQKFLEIPIRPIEGYHLGDASAGDLDGDGEWEIVVHQSSRPRDNGSAGVTGSPILDAYKLDGTHLWRIDLGKNIRDGEHYTQFMVYDLDGDGKAEVACKTADGSSDGTGHVIGDASKDWRTLDPTTNRNGRILEGPEYFTVFDGPTGAALQTVDYIPSRDPIDGWGGIGGNAGNDNYGNRCDRFLACVAYLDGVHPSVVMCRGVYGRIVVAAWDWRDSKLTSRWVFDTGVSYPPFDDASPYSGMGGHGVSVADVDGDGRDEIVYQAMVVDDDGTGLYSTGLRHGDAMYVGDLDPARPGLEVFTIQENEEHAALFQSPGAAFRDARTGEILWQHSLAIDVPSGMAADIDPRHEGFEMWGGPGGLRDVHGNTIGPAPRESRWSIWWDGDPLRELLSTGRVMRRRFVQRQGDETYIDSPGDVRIIPTRISKWNWESGSSSAIEELEGFAMGHGPSLAGDLLGDWREEVLLIGPDGKSLRLYTTTIPTQIRSTTLLADRQYRLGLVWQNVVYNKPCYPSYYLGSHGPPETTQAEPVNP